MKIMIGTPAYGGEVTTTYCDALIWLYDHFLYEGGYSGHPVSEPVLECFTTLGALAATGLFDMRILVPTLILAAITGNTVNYSIGARVAHRFLSSDGGRIDGPLGRFVKPKHVHEAHAFFLKHGGKAVTLAQFVPIVRTFLPFVAGGAGMPYRAFLTYNAVGAVAWVGICAGAGYLFGNIPVVKQNFELVVLGIVGVSLLPLALELIKMRRRRPA